MKLIRIKKITDNYFNQAWELYEAAFPFKERKSLENQIYVLEKDNYHFNIIIEKNQFIGFILWWNFESYRFIDHFATTVKQRNKGKGKQILNTFINTNNKPILLEVELPISNLNKRRIKFYEKAGFTLNNHYYEIPPLEKNQSPLQLLLMSHPNSISKKEVDLFIANYHTDIYKNYCNNHH